MKNRTYNELEEWEKIFYDLNMKFGNEIWGARIENDSKIIIFSEGKNLDLMSRILLETSGKILDYKILFVIKKQETIKTT